MEPVAEARERGGRIRGLRFFLFSTKNRQLEKNTYLLGAEVAFSIGKRGRRVNKASTGYRFSPVYICMYTCIHVGGTYLPIPSRSGRDDVDTLGSKTPVNDDSNIGKCDNVFFLPCVGAR